MSKYKVDQELTEDYKTTLTALLSAIKDLDWILISKKSDVVVCKEFNIKPLIKKTTNDATIEITINESQRKILYKGKNFGFGPIQSTHVKKQVLLVKEKLEQNLKRGNTSILPRKESSSDTPNASAMNVSLELKKISDLLKNGILTEEEFENAKQRILNK